MVQRSIAKVSVKPITNSFHSSRNFSSLYLSSTTALATFRTQGPKKLDLMTEKVLHRVLKYHRTHKPKYTTKIYALKQKKWKVKSSYMSFYHGTVLIFSIAI